VNYYQNIGTSRHFLLDSYPKMAFIPKKVAESVKRLNPSAKPVLAAGFENAKRP
jgi:hypothetical protein